MQCSKERSLFDHYIGKHKQFVRNGEAERLRGPEVDHQLVFGRQHKWQIGNLGAPESFSDIKRRTAVRVYLARSIAHQASRRGVFADIVECDNALALRERNDPAEVAGEESVP